MKRRPPSDVKITAGGAVEDEASCRFIDAWHRAESGEVFPERHLAFENWNVLAGVLTGKRVELLHARARLQQMRKRTSVDRRCLCESPAPFGTAFVVGRR